MANVIADITEGSIRRDSGGWHATRVFDVRNVGGAAIAKPYNASFVSGVPTYGEPHPTIPGIRVISIQVDHTEADPEVYHVTVEYGGDTVGTTPGLAGSGLKDVDVSTSTLRQTGFRDINDELMQVTYIGPTVRVNLGGSLTNNVVEFPVLWQTQLVEGEWDIPIATVTCTVERAASSHVATLAQSTRINSDSWSGLAPYQWLLLGIDSSRNASGTFDWRYVLAIAPQFPKNQTWRLRGQTTLVDDSVPALATEGNGVKTFDLYRTANFSSMLGFQIPF